MRQEDRFARLASTSLTRRSTLAGLGAAALAAASGRPSLAAAWPTRPVTVIVPYAAGGNTDMMARLASDYISRKTGQPFIIENRGGGSGLIGAMATLQKPADGHTFMFGSSAQIFNIPMLQKVTYNPHEDFVPVSIFGAGPYLLAIRSELPPKTLGEFIDYVKERPGKLNYGTAGPSGNVNLNTALFLHRAGLKMVAVPYKSGAPAMTGLASGNVEMYFGNASEVMLHTENKNIRILAVTTTERLAQLPDVPTVAETFPGFEGSSWNGFFALKGTPQEAIDGMVKYTIEAAKQPEIIKRLQQIAILPYGTTQAEFKEVIKKTAVTIRESMEAAGLPIIN